MNGTVGIRHDDYVANDSQGLTSTSTRTVIVEPATVPLPASSANASSTTATSSSAGQSSALTRITLRAHLRWRGRETRRRGSEVVDHVPDYRPYRLQRPRNISLDL